MIGPKWVRDFCYGAFELTPEPTDYGFPSPAEEPDLTSAEAKRWRSSDLALYRDYSLGHHLARIMDQTAPRAKEPKDQLGTSIGGRSRAMRSAARQTGSKAPVRRGVLR